MPTLHFELSEALASCPSTIGMGPFSLKQCMTDLLSSPLKPEILGLELSDGSRMELMIHRVKGKTVITALDSLSTDCEEGVSLELLPEILAILKENGIAYTALQFPHAFMVKGRFSEAAYRAHFNHIVLYKDSPDHFTASLIESTTNPVGIYNPIPVLGWFASNSLLSGKELLQVKLMRLLNQADPKMTVTNPVLTCKQANLNDKRCGIFVLNTMVALVNYMTSEKAINGAGITEIAIAAHQQLNEPEMMAISFPVEKSCN